MRSRLSAELARALRRNSRLYLDQAGRVAMRPDFVWNNNSHSHTVRHAGVRIHCHALDLSAEPAELLAAVRQLAATLVEAG